MARQLAILLIITTVVALNRDRLEQITGVLIVVLLLLNSLGYLAGYTGARVLRLDEGMRRALSLEIGMQNAGVGTSLAMSLFEPASAIPTAAYTFGCMLTGTLLAQWWAWFSDVRQTRSENDGDCPTERCLISRGPRARSHRAVPVMHPALAASHPGRTSGT